MTQASSLRAALGRHGNPGPPGPRFAGWPWIATAKRPRNDGFLVDARWFQICSLTALLGCNIARFDLGATLPQSAVMLASVLVAQAILCRLCRVRFDPLSPLITGLSLSLLLRTNEPWLWVAAPALAMASKFGLRACGKHVFNPANFAIVAMLASGAEVWVSPGQWGTRMWLAALVILAGTLVLSRSRRLDTACMFLGSYAGLLLWRAAWLGDPWTIPWHQLQTGSLLIFTFFMITDPRSTPDRRAGRLVFAVAVALLAYHLQFDLQLRTGLFYALAAVSLATPLIDWLLPAARFGWRPKSGQQKEA